jgi:replication factor C small subunit
MIANFDVPLEWFAQFYPEIVARLLSFIEQKSMPHLLFTGSKCVEKGLIAKLFIERLMGNTSGGVYNTVFCKEPVSDEEMENVSSTNTSKSKLGATGETRLVNKFIEARVRPYIENQTLNKQFRCLIIHDFNVLKKEQEAFRRIMEKYTENCRFILIADSINNIIDPILSRCNIMYFNEYSDEKYDNALISLLSNHGINATKPMAKDLRVTVGKNFVLALLLAQTALLQYRNINASFLQQIYRKNEYIKTIARSVVSNNYNNSFSEIKRYAQYNVLEWESFASSLFDALLNLSFAHKEKFILLLSEFDANYNEENPVYYIHYFLMTLKKEFS